MKITMILRYFRIFFRILQHVLAVFHAKSAKRKSLLCMIGAYRGLERVLGCLACPWQASKLLAKQSGAIFWCASLENMVLGVFTHFTAFLADFHANRPKQPLLWMNGAPFCAQIVPHIDRLHPKYTRELRFKDCWLSNPAEQKTPQNTTCAMCLYNHLKC